MSNLTPLAALPVALSDPSIAPADRDRRSETWLAQRCGVRLEPKGWPTRGLNAIATKQCPDISLAQRAVTEMLKPATDSQLRAALATLSVRVSRSPGSADAADLQIAVYVRSLKAYPFDIALAALEHWPERDAKEAKFWPSWAELQEQLDEAFAFRRALLPALSSIKRLPEREPEPPSEADIAEVRARTAAIVEQLNAQTHRKRGAGLEPFRERVEKHAADRIARRKAALAALPGART